MAPLLCHKEETDDELQGHCDRELAEFLAHGRELHNSEDIKRAVEKRDAAERRRMRSERVAHEVFVDAHDAVRHPERRARERARRREVERVASARGVELAADPATLVFEVARRTGANRSSMLQDVERGAPTEIEALNGAVAREGRRLGIPTPVNQWLYQQVARRAAPGQAAVLLSSG